MPDVRVGYKEVPVTHLRTIMLEELQRCNYSENPRTPASNALFRCESHSPTRAKSGADTCGFWIFWIIGKHVKESLAVNLLSFRQSGA